MTDARVAASRRLNGIATMRGTTLALTAIARLLSDPRVTSVIVGASSVRQLKANLKAMGSPVFTTAELDEISSVAVLPGVAF